MPDPSTEPPRSNSASAVAAALADEPQQWLQTIFDHAAPGMFLTDMHGKLLRVNAALCRMLGRSAEDLIGRDSEAYTHPEERGTRRTLLDRINANGSKPVKTNRRYIKPDGSVVWLKLSLTVVEQDGRAVGVVGTATDITRIKATTRRLRESEARFRELADAMPQIVWSASPDGHVDYFNRQVVRVHRAGRGNGRGRGVGAGPDARRRRAGASDIGRGRWRRVRPMSWRSRCAGRTARFGGCWRGGCR